MNLATIEFGGIKFKTGNVEGSGGHPLQSKSNNESRPSPELATKCPALNCVASKNKLLQTKYENIDGINNKIIMYAFFTIWTVYVDPKFQFVTKFYFRHLSYVSSDF